MEDSLIRYTDFIATEDSDKQEIVLKKLVALHFLSAVYDESNERFIGVPYYDLFAIRDRLKSGTPLRFNRTLFLRSDNASRYVFIYSFSDYLRAGMYLRFLIPFYILIIAITGCMYYVSYVFFIRPVTAITRSTKLITQGNYDVHVTEDGIAEIRTLANHFNDMSSTVKNTMQVLNYVIDNLGVGFAVLQGDGVVRHSNKKLESLYGGTIQGLHAHEIFPFLHTMLDDEKFNNGLFFTQTFSAMDGTPVFADFVLVGMKTENGYDRILIIQKRADELQSACAVNETALKTLSSVIAHEIKNPLNVIAMIVKTLEKKYPEEKKWDDIDNQLQFINSVASHMGLLIEYTPEPIELAQFTTNLLMHWETVFNDSNVRFSIEATISPLIYFDRMKLKIICDNIIKNALEERRDSLTLTVILRQSDEHVYLDITDNGNGFDADQLIRLIQLGYTTKEQGTGIGMYIIRLLLAMGGATMELITEKGRFTTLSMRFIRHENTSG